MRIFIISDLIDPQYCLLIEDKRKEKFVQVLILWIVKLRIIANFKIWINLIKILNLFFPKFAVKSKGIYISMFNKNFDLLAKNSIRVYGIFYLKDYRVFSMHFVEFAS